MTDTAATWVRRNAPPDEQFLVAHEFIERARNNLNRNIWDYLIGGTETETTVARNRLALDSVAFRPRVLVDVSRVDATGHFFGRKTRLPIALAPVGSLESFEPGGRRDRGAGGGGVRRAVLRQLRHPTWPRSGRRRRHRAKSVSALCAWRRWLHRRPCPAGDRSRLRRVLHHGGHSTLQPPRTRPDQALPEILAGAGGGRFPGRAELGPYRAVQGQACRAAHPEGHRHRRGTRAARSSSASMASTSPTMAAASSIMAAARWRCCPKSSPRVGGRAKIIVDGGFSRGTDIIKGIALGADTVAIGRLYVYGLAANGADGIIRLLEILENEVEQSLGLLGATRLSDVDKSFLHAATPVVPPHVHSAFPHLNLPRETY